MSERIVLHIGPRKTGTTFIQRAMNGNAEWLAERGFTVPFADDKRGLERAISLPGSNFHRDDSAALRARLIEEVRTAPGTVILSTELFSVVDDETVRTLLSDLPDVPVATVFAVRDLGRQIPAVWQQHIRASGTQSLETYLSAVRRPDHRFWPAHSPALLFERWRELTGGEVSAVVMPSKGAPPELLWHRFCEAVGVDPEGSVLDRDRTNKSLGLVQAEVLREVNVALAGRLAQPKSTTVTHALTLPVLQQAPGPLVPIGVSVRDYEWVAERQAQINDDLRAEGAVVIGDPAELVVPPASEATIDVTDKTLLVESVRALAEALVVFDEAQTLAARRLEIAERRHELVLATSERRKRKVARLKKRVVALREELAQRPVPRRPLVRRVGARVKRTLRR